MPYSEIESIDKLASLLGCSTSFIKSFESGRFSRSLYTTFHINKRSGGKREIRAPRIQLKTYQKKLCEYLYVKLENNFRSHAHAYVKRKGICTNAQNHIQSDWVLSFDLKNFFETITWARVKGLLQSPPFLLDQQMSLIVSNFVTVSNVLPQGAPTSPIISNMICYKLDKILAQFARVNRLNYTRYADDIVFSGKITLDGNIPECVGTLTEHSFTLSPELIGIIKENGFAINHLKTKLARKNINRQLVTGVVVNSKVNVSKKYYRDLRRLLHVYSRNPKTASDFFLKSNQIRLVNRPYFKGSKLNIKSVIRGRVVHVGYVGGYLSPRYLRLRRTLMGVDKGFYGPHLFSKPKDWVHTTQQRLNVYTEGRTDPEHLIMALKYFNNAGKFRFQDIRFHSLCGDGGLMAKARVATSIRNQVELFLFDNDSRGKLISDGLLEESSVFFKRNPGVYIVCPPRPISRERIAKVSIELYYEDSILMREDTNGRRLYVRDEFDNAGFHKTILGCHIRGASNPNVCLSPQDVFKSNAVCEEVVFESAPTKNVALSKADFVEMLKQSQEIHFANFSIIFNALGEAVVDSILCDAVQNS